MSGISILIIIGCTLFAVYNILRLYGVFEWTPQISRTTARYDNDKKYKKKVRLWTNILKTATDTTNMFKGLLMNEGIYQDHLYFISRLNLKSEILNRTLTPYELRGLFATPALYSLLLIPLGIFFPGILIIPVICFIVLFNYQTYFRLQIQDEDSVIDDYFIELYLLLYSELRKGSRARIKETVRQYTHVLEHTQSTKEAEVMLKLSKYLLNLLNTYEDHIAVSKLREIYKSATVINFCNVAGQSLAGVDNLDNLLTFRQQLETRKVELMHKKQQAMLRAGNRSIYLIWAILVMFIVVGWYSKLPKGFF